MGREPRSPHRTSLRGTRRRARRRPGWQNRGGSGGVRSPLPSMGDNRVRPKAPRPGTGAVRAPCSLAPLSDAAVTGAQRASRRRQDRGSPSPHVFVSSGAHGKWESVPHSSPVPATAEGNHLSGASSPGRGEHGASSAAYLSGGADPAEPGRAGQG